MALLSNLIENSFADIPSLSGVYLMKNKKGDIVYVGKALNLKNRVRSYFVKSGDSRYYVQFLTDNVYAIDYIITNSEKEAFLLENSLIKHHNPKYNIQLRDDKSFLGIKIDLKQRYPKLELIRTRHLQKDKALYFGPFYSSNDLKDTLKIIHDIFPLRRCSDNVMKSKTRPCLMHDIGKCLAPCCLTIDETVYKNYLDQTILFLQGKTDDIVKSLTSLMNKCSENMEFEKAANIRDKIYLLQRTLARQQVSELKNINRDVISHYYSDDEILFIILFYRSGSLIANQTFKFKIYDQDIDEVYHSFISQYYSSQRFIPNEIITSVVPQNKELLEEWLTEQRGTKVEILTPQRGDKKSIIELAEKNAQELFKADKKKIFDAETILSNIQKKLNLNNLPNHIECFDISNIQGTDAYGSMVCFKEGKPSKKDYRIFKIKSVEGPDDYSSMKEVITRRYQRIINEGQQLPDLVLIDGGKGQLNITVEVFNELGIHDVNLAGIAKIKLISRSSKNEKTEERFFLPKRKNPITFRKGSAELLLLEYIRDEAHRFAITHHKKERIKKSLTSVLDQIENVGEKRKKALLKHFGSLTKIKSASLEELIKSKIIPEKTAKDIFNFFNKTNNT